jgi:fatty-acyl-CoA synthase
MKGYWNQPEVSAEVMRGDWFHTGDMVAVTPEGCILIVDRKKDIIVSGGENISSLEVEKVILAHPSVIEAGVIPVSDEKWGEVPKALVILRPGMSATDAEIIAFCRESLSHYKCPCTVEFVAELPKTATGKILKKDLRRQYDRAPAQAQPTT